jgi:hypothetical protein
LLSAPGNPALLAQQAQTPAAATGQEPVKPPPGQLDSLVAPIALYPDPMLSQTLVASTFPLEIIQLHQFRQKNPSFACQGAARLQSCENV